MPRPDIEAIKARTEAATPWPWTAYAVEGCAILDQAKRGQVPFGCHPNGDPDMADATFCAYSRQDIPDLLAYIAELEAEIAQAKHAYESHP